VCACRWFVPAEDQSWVVGASVFRATTTSLGSISFGALIVAIIEALRTLVWMHGFCMWH
jgi:hypothetical protein